MRVDSITALREALRTARPDQNIDLEPGEYHGPIVIERPVRLRGLGRKTVLWRHAGPVIHVRAAGVRLERLLVERTVLAQGPLVVHDRGCIPTGKESVEIDGDTLVTLGELFPGSTLSIPLTLSVTARTEITVTGVYGAYISPAVLEAPGTHQVTLTLDGSTLKRGEVLLGEITLREGGSTRWLWLTGTVLDSPAPDQPLCAVSGKSRLYPAVGGLTLGESLFAMLGASLPAGAYGTLQRDPSGALALYVPDAAPSPILLNGEPVAARSRRLLRERDSIRIGPLALEMRVAEPLPIALETSAIAFDDFGAAFPEAVPLAVRPVKSGWRGQVVAGVEWLSVEPEGYFRVPPSRPKTWTVALNAAALNLADGEYNIPGGVLIEGDNQIVAVDVRLRVQRPAVALQVAPLDLGACEHGWPVDRVLEVGIVNAGRGAWSGAVQSGVPWLEVLSPMPVGGQSWAETPVQVRFRPVWDRLAPGVHDVPDALIITPESADPAAQSEPYRVPARIEVTPPLGHLSPGVTQIDFPEVEYGGPLPEAALPLTNTGAAPWIGTVAALNGWVRVLPEQFELAPGESAALAVELLDVPADQPLDTPLLLDQIIFEAGPGAAPLPEPVSVYLTIVERPPYLTARSVSFQPFVKGDSPPDGMLIVHNMGPGIWRGQITANIAWLVAPEREFTCAPDETVSIPISLSARAAQELPPGLTRWEAALSVGGGREPVTVSAQVDVRDAPTALHLETPILNFGVVSDDIAGAPVEMVRLLNAGPLPWKGTVTLKAPWLSLERAARAFDLEVPGMHVVEFRVLLNERLLAQPPGVMIDDAAILIEAHRQADAERQTLAVRAQLVVIESAPYLVVEPAHITLAQNRPGAITIRNAGTRRWTLNISAAPWLAVSPAQCTLGGGQSGRIEVRYQLPDGAAPPSDMGPPQPLHDPRAVVIYGPGREIEVPVEVMATAIAAARRRARAAASDLARVAPSSDPGGAAPESASQQPDQPPPAAAPAGDTASGSESGDSEARTGADSRRPDGA